MSAANPRCPLCGRKQSHTIPNPSFPVNGPARLVCYERPCNCRMVKVVEGRRERQVPMKDA